MRPAPVPRSFVVLLACMWFACNGTSPKLPNPGESLCEGDADCAHSPLGPHCSPVTKFCVVCADDTQCPSSAPQCNKLHNRCVDCVADGQCMPGQICTHDGKCMPGCDENNPCPAGKVCDTTTNTCVGCVTNTDCPVDVPCDTTTPTCGCGACVSDADCPSSAVCVDTCCIPGCDGAHPECAPGQRCDADAGVCASCSDAGC